MFNYRNTRQPHPDTSAADSAAAGEQDIPEPLDAWSERDFDDLVPAWRTR